MDHTDSGFLHPLHIQPNSYHTQHCSQYTIVPKQHPPAMPNSIPQWSPQEVLEIENIFTCSGWAHSKGRKCYNRIAKENRELATDIMDDMADLDIRSADFKASLKSLAKPLLCRAYHTKDPDQHTALRKQWRKHIEAYKVTVNARRRPAARPHRSTSVAVDTVESLQEEVESLRALLMQRTAEPAIVEHGSSVVSSTLSTQTTRIHQTTGPETERQRVHTITDHSQHIRSVSEQRTRNVAVDTTRSPPGDDASSLETNRPRSPRPTNPSSRADTEAESSHPASQPIPNTTSRQRIRVIAVNTTVSPPRDSASPVEGNPPRSPLPTASSPSENTDAGSRQSASQPIPNTTARQSTRNVAVNTTHSPPTNNASPLEGHPPRSPLPITLSSTANIEAASNHPTSHPTPNTTPRQHHHAPTPPEMTQTTPTHTHQATSNENQGRKAISGDCSICCEDLKTGENISWCKAQCGQNFHANCVGVWLATLAAGRSRTCPYCRVSWVG